MTVKLIYIYSLTKDFIHSRPEFITYEQYIALTTALRQT